MIIAPAVVKLRFHSFRRAFAAACCVVARGCRAQRDPREAGNVGRADDNAVRGVAIPLGMPVGRCVSRLENLSLASHGIDTAQERPDEVPPRTWRSRVGSSLKWILLTCYVCSTMLRL